MELLGIINYGFVLLFGVVLTFVFAEISFRKNYLHYIVTFCGFGILQIITYFLLGETFSYKAYPVLIHFPLFLLLKFYYKKNAYLSGICVLSAYLFCTPRKWIGTLVSFFYHYNHAAGHIAEIIITIPLLILIITYISPYIIRLKYESSRILKLFLLLPFIYYILEYSFTVYTDLLYHGDAVLVEFMDAFIVILYFILAAICLKTFYEKQEMEVQQVILQSIAAQARFEIEALRKSEMKSAIYRHDLRHHMNYLNACIAENRLKEASAYIAQTCEGLDNIKVMRYSANEPLNLILSSYAAKAKEKKIPIYIEITATDFSRFQITDLCSLLSNALENALTACGQVEPANERYVRLHMYEKSRRLCLNVRNSYNQSPVFKDGIPVAFREGHGMGVRSMVSVIEKYQGIYQFSAENNVFSFQLSM